MLVLSRKVNETVRIGDNIEIAVTEIDRNRVRLPVNKLDLPAKLIDTLKENEFETIEAVSDWVEREHREPIKRLGESAIVKIRNAVNRFVSPYHKAITMPELEKAKTTVAELSGEAGVQEKHSQ